MTVGLLVDNDIVIKLAKIDAYRDGLLAMNIALESVASVGVMLHYMANLAGRCVRMTEAESNRLLAILPTIAAEEPTREEQVFATRLMKVVLENELDADEGEILLFAMASLRPNVYIATGDKRAMRGLGTLGLRERLLLPLRGRVLCFEHFCIALARAHGFRRIQIAVRASRSADETLNAAADYFAASSGRGFIHGLEAAIEERIERDSPGWLKAV